MFSHRVIIPLFLFPIFGFTQDKASAEPILYEENTLLADLAIVREIDQKNNFELPLIMNYQVQGGYFTMPSARMAHVGNVGLGFASVEPYYIYSANLQYFDHWEVTACYWVFRGITEWNFGHLGYGDDADRTANLKYTILRETDGYPFLPELAAGVNDFVGTKRFWSYYFAATKSIKSLNLEMTLGWGNGRIRGLFGGVAWSPFAKWNNFLRGISFIAEYDANDYRNHPDEHPEGRQVDSRINYGVQYQLSDILRGTVSSLRGKELAGSISINYNLGDSKGFFPKYYDPLPYTAPIDREPIGHLRSEKQLSQELAHSFQEQGLDLYTVLLTTDSSGGDALWMKIINDRYRTENVVRGRIEHVLGSIVPANISTVTVVLEAEGVTVQEYQYRTNDLVLFSKEKMGSYELHTLSPMENVGSIPNEYESTILYHRNKSIWTLTFRPRLQTYFGSAEGKFKYDFGFILSPEGYIFDKIYYDLQLSYILKSNTGNIKDRDTLNPSQLINVRSDTICYWQSNSFHVDHAYVQTSWNLGNGWFTRAALGYFEIAYGGYALEALYYPANSFWAVGVDFANVWKRSYHGLGFQTQVRRLEGNEAVKEHFVGLQYFLDFYYDYKPLNLDFKFSFGQFLAKDKGLKIEMRRTFESGMQIGLWYAFTTGKDTVNGDRYHDKGIAISLPLDMFMNKSSRSEVGYSIAAWLRDVAAVSDTGKPLYPVLYSERYKIKESYY